MGVSVTNSNGQVFTREFAENYRATHGNAATFRDAKTVGLSNEQIATLFDVSSHEVDVYEGSLGQSTNTPHGGTSASGNPIAVNGRESKGGGNSQNQSSTDDNTPRPRRMESHLGTGPLDVAKASDTLYGPGDKSIPTSEIANALKAIVAKYPGQPEAAAKEVLAGAVRYGVNAQQLADTGLFTKDQIDTYLGSQGISPAAKSPRIADSIRDVVLSLNVGRALSDWAPQHNPDPVDTGSRRTIFGAGDKSISNVDLDLAVDLVWNKYGSNPSEAVWAVLAAATPSGVSAQQLANLGKPNLTLSAINDTLASKGVKPLPTPWIQNSDLASAVDDATKEAAGTGSSDDWQLSSYSSVRKLFGAGNKEISNADLNMAIDTIQGQLAGDPDRAAMTTLAALVDADVNIDQVANLGRPGLTRESIVSYLASKGINPPATVTSEQLATSKATFNNAVAVETAAYTAFQNASPADYERTGQIWAKARDDLDTAFSNYSSAGRDFHHDYYWKTDVTQPLRTPILRADGVATSSIDIARANYGVAVDTMFSMTSSSDGVEAAWNTFNKVEDIYRTFLSAGGGLENSMLLGQLGSTHSALSVLVSTLTMPRFTSLPTDIGSMRAQFGGALGLGDR